MNRAEEIAALEEIVSNGSAPRRPSFSAPKVARKLTDEFPAAKGGERLYAFVDGRYRPDGVAFYRKALIGHLGDGWKSSRAAEVVQYVEDNAPVLWEAPPVDRIAVRNGILDLGDMTLGPSDPAFLSPVQLPVQFDPSAECPNFEAFLADTVDVDLRRVVLELFGYAATPNNRLQKAFLLLGPGGSGKSTLLEVLTALLGPENVAGVSLHRLEDRFGPAELYGRLANVYADLDAAYLKAASTFKSVVGGDRITAERKYGAGFEFAPFARMFFSANEPPPTADNSNAWFRRWVVLPFDRAVPEKEMDRGLAARLTTPSELSGILNRSLEVLPDLLARGTFTETEATDQAAEAFRTDSDSVAGFVDERITLDAEAKVPQAVVYPAYKDWAEESNRRPLGKQRFNRRFLELLPTVFEGKVSGVRYWKGAALEGGDR